MTSMVGLFPNVEDVAVDLLAGFVAPGSVGLITPSNLGSVMPFIRVGCIGGTDDYFTDRSTLDVDVFAASIPDAALLAEQIRQFLISGPHLVGGVVFDKFGTVTRPRQFPWPNTDVFRNSATYRASARRRTT